MELTGKAKKEFDKWLDSVEYHEIGLGEEFCDAYDLFNELPFSMQWGVYLDFFDRVNIEIDHLFSNAIYLFLALNNGEGKVSDYREKAQKEAIEKANELFNQSLIGV